MGELQMGMGVDESGEDGAAGKIMNGAGISRTEVGKRARFDDTAVFDGHSTAGDGRRRYWQNV